MKKWISIFTNLFLIFAIIITPSFVYAEEESGDLDDPYTIRDTDQFYKDENGEYASTSMKDYELYTKASSSLLVDTIKHNSIFSTSTYRYGIDVSQWQGTINWNKVASQGVEFAFIRVGYRGYVNPRIVKDTSFDQNMKNATNAGIKVGVYFYSKAITVKEAIEQADYVVQQISEYNLDLPIMLDVEYDGTEDRLQNANLSKEQLTEIVEAFIQRCEEKGYSAGIYASASLLYNDVDGKTLGEQYPVWLAHWVESTNYSLSYRFWQYSSKATVDGISGRVDVDVWYDDGTDFNRGFKIYRIYNPNSGEHFYTSSATEKNYLLSLGWNDEGVGWTAPKSGNPVYRLYNAIGGEHHYTLSIEERDSLVGNGWTYEGIGWYSSNANDANAILLYREYNPNAFANNHNYTTSKTEHNWLLGLGWKDEGIAWYGTE